MAEIKFTIRKDGTIIEEASGFAGTACQEASATFARLGKVTNETLKPEAFEAPGLHEHNCLKGG